MEMKLPISKKEYSAKQLAELKMINSLNWEPKENLENPEDRAAAKAASVDASVQSARANLEKIAKEMQEKAAQKQKEQQRQKEQQQTAESTNE